MEQNCSQENYYTRLLGYSAIFAPLRNEIDVDMETLRLKKTKDTYRKLFVPRKPMKEICHGGDWDHSQNVALKGMNPANKLFIHIGLSTIFSRLRRHALLLESFESLR